jgi:hypothetical protein
MAIAQDQTTKDSQCVIHNEVLFFPEVKCNEDENKVADPRGGFKCIKIVKAKTLEYNAKDCIKNFKPLDSTKLIIPLDYKGDPDFSNAHLEGFEFKLVCPVVKQKEEQ